VSDDTTTEAAGVEETEETHIVYVPNPKFPDRTKRIPLSVFREMERKGKV
jgi:hypothetical protein